MKPAAPVSVSVTKYDITNEELMRFKKNLILIIDKICYPLIKTARNTEHANIVHEV